MPLPKLQPRRNIPLTQDYPRPPAVDLNSTLPRSPTNTEHAVRGTSSRGSSTTANTRTTARRASSSTRPNETLSNAADVGTVRSVSPARDEDAMDTSTHEGNAVLVSDLRLNERPTTALMPNNPEHINALIANNMNNEFEHFLAEHPAFADRHHPQRKACVFVCSPVSIANGDHYGKNLPDLSQERLVHIQSQIRGYRYFVENHYGSRSRPTVWYDMQTFGQHLVYNMFDCYDPDGTRPGGRCA